MIADTNPFDPGLPLIRMHIALCISEYFVVCYFSLPRRIEVQQKNHALGVIVAVYGSWKAPFLNLRAQVAFVKSAANLIAVHEC